MLDDFATSADTRDGLRKAFLSHQITKVNKGYGPIDTVNHAVITDRLNEVCPGWTMSKPEFLEVDGKDGQKHVMAVLCSMTIGSVTRWEIGEVEHPSTYGDEAKKAMSDWIKRAAMRFGVGIDLWQKSVGESTARGSVQAAAPVAASPSSVGAGVTRK